MQIHSAPSGKELSAKAAAAALNDRRQDAEKLVHELRNLLARHEATLDREGIRHKVEMLERWVESYRSGLLSAAKAANTGLPWLAEFRDKLKFSAEELRRLESEGGNSAPSGAHAAEADDLAKTTRRIDQVLPVLEQLLEDLKAMK